MSQSAVCWVCGCVWLAVLILSCTPGVEPGPCRSKRNLKQFSLEDVLAKKYAAKGFKGTWVSGTEFIFTNQTSGDIIKYDVTTSESTEFIKKEVMEKYSASSYELSPDQLFVLIRYDQKPGFRYSSSARCVVYDLTTMEYKGVARQQLLNLSMWAPLGHGMAFVLNNDLYYRSPGGHEKRITNDGVPGIVYNGVADWVYEEEVLSSGSAVWFSPDGEKMAYAAFNDTRVKMASYWHYGKPGTIASQYPEAVNVRYPKPGTPNPDVTLNVVDLYTPTWDIVPLPAPTSSVSKDHILAQVTWTGDHVSAVWLNRVQNIAHFSEYTIQGVGPNKVFEIKEELGWLEIERPIYDSTGSQFLTLMSTPQPKVGNYRHLVLVAGGTATPLTSGRLVVTKIYGWDEANKVVYYQATEEGQPSRRHVYAATTDGAGTPVCLSCDVTTIEDNDCTFASASFSKNYTHYALVCSGPDPAQVGIYQTDTGELLEIWEDNKKLRESLANKALPVVVDTEVDVEGGFKAKARLLLPSDMDKSGATKYPMLVFVYAGPNSVKVTDTFAISWGTYLASNRSIIYCMIDARGSGLKGDSMLFAVYRRLGSVEIEDQISVVKVLTERYDYIDPKRVGIWGWSYGGYATAMALAKDKDGVFKCGAAVAPVTSWLYYDTIYTERYMGLPTAEDNLAGYNASDVTTRVENFKNKKFYLLHGNEDDNVHYMQSMMLTIALESADILFRQQSYPNENHSITGKLLHLYRSMDQFWTDCFNLESD